MGLFGDEGVEVPDVFGILGDGAVAGELAGAGGVHERGFVPCLRIAIEGFDSVLRLDEGGEVLEEHIVVVEVQEVFQERLEDAGGHQGEDVAADHVEGALDFRIGVVNLAGVVGGAEFIDFFGLEAEDDDVVFADFLCDFDVCAVKGAEGDGTIEHEFHVAGAGGLGACKGDLLGDVGCRDDLFCEGDAVVGEEGHRDASAYERMIVDHFRHAVNEADDKFGHPVARCSLCAEDEDTRMDVEVGLFDEAVEEHDDVEHEQELALIFVQTLHLNIKDGIGIDLEAEGIEDGVREDLLVGAFDVGKLFEEGRIASELLQALEFGEVGDPRIANSVGDEVGQARVGLEQPATLGDAVSLVGEVVGHHFVEIAEDGLLEDFRVQGGDAVDRARADKAEIGHTHILVAAFINEAHAAETRQVAGIEVGHLLQEAGVNLVDDLHMTGQDALHEGHGPLFKGFRQHGVIGITGAGAHEFPCFVPRDTLG